MKRCTWGDGALKGSLLAAATLALGAVAGCGDDAASDDGQGGSVSSAGSGVAGQPTSGAGGSTSSGGTAVTSGGSTSAGGTTVGTAGSSGDASLGALCTTVCTAYYQACPTPNVESCTDICNRLANTPQGCATLQRNYLSCLSERTPNCGNNSWSYGYEEMCDNEGRGLCLRTGGADCIAGEAYDDTLCQTSSEGNFGYYCQKTIAPKPGCKFSEYSTYEGLYCCESALTL